MSTLSVNVARTTANYEQTIQYTLNASFNSLTQTPSSQISITCFIPDSVSCFYHSPTYPIQEIVESPTTGGHNLVFILASLPESGVSLYFDLYINFKLSTPNLTPYTMQVTLAQLGLPDQIVYAPTVTLNAVANYIASQTTILPNANGGASGDDFVYEIILENIGDQGGPMTNFILTEVLPTPLTLDTTHPITGMDISNNDFADPSADGLTATIIDSHNFSFAIPSYRGSKYAIRFKGYTAPNLEIGNEYITVGTYSYTANRAVGPRTCNDVFQIQSPTSASAVTIYAPDYTKPGALFNFTSTFVNTGNTALKNAFFHFNNVSEGATPYAPISTFNTGLLYLPELQQVISIPCILHLTTLKGTSVLPMTIDTAISQTIQVSDLNLPPGDEVVTIEYDFQADVPVGATLDPPLSCNGLISSSAPDPSYAYLNSTCEWITSTGTPSQTNNNFTITIDHISELAMTATAVPLDVGVKPGDFITYQASIDCSHSPLTDPVLVLILNPKLTYAHTIDYQYTDFFGGSTDSIPRPIPTVIPHYNGGPNTIFMVSYSGADSYTFNQLATIKITISFTVNADVTGLITQNLLLGTYNGNFTVAPGFDTYNVVQPDGSMRTLLTTPTFTNAIEMSMGLTSDFLVKGFLDTQYIQYPDVSHTLAGEPIHYQLSLTNRGSTSLNSVEIVNILPHIGDTGVILTQVYRLSQFSVYPLSFSTPTLTPTVSGDPTPIFSVQYSQSYDPIRFGSDLNSIIGTVDDWSTTPPTDMTKVKSYKLTLTQGVFRPAQTLAIIALAMVPPGTPAELYAWDSFATHVTYTDEDGILRAMLPVEPEMAGVKVDAPPIQTITLGGFVFEDLAKDGIYQAGDPGVNDVAVLLYDGSGRLVQTVFTSPNSFGQPGYYSFSGIPHGYYSLRFVPNTRLYSLTTQVLTNPQGSMPSPQTGFTPLIDMTVLSENLGILAGVTPINQLDTILAFNKQANKTLRSVIYNQMLLGMKLEDTKKLIP